MQTLSNHSNKRPICLKKVETTATSFAKKKLMTFQMHLQKCKSVQNMVKIVQYLVDQTFWGDNSVGIKKRNKLLGDNSNLNTVLS